MGDLYTKQIVRKNGGYKSGCTNAVVLDLFIRNECSKEREHQYCNQYRMKGKLNGKERNQSMYPSFPLFPSLLSFLELGALGFRGWRRRRLRFFLVLRGRVRTLHSVLVLLELGALGWGRG